MGVTVKSTANRKGGGGCQTVGLPGLRVTSKEPEGERREGTVLLFLKDRAGLEARRRERGTGSGEAVGRNGRQL